jgi:hypothetical protein
MSVIRSFPPRSDLIHPVPSRSAFVIVADGEAPLVCQPKRGRQAGRQLGDDLADPSVDPAAAPLLQGIGDMMAKPAQQRTEHARGRR